VAADRLTATYVIDSVPELIESRAEALAIEQSVECPLEAIREQRIRDEIVARVASIEPAGAGRFRVAVEIAVETTGFETAQLINMIFGNASLWEHVQLVGLELRPSCWRISRDRATASPGFVRSWAQRGGR
jgi:ribulose-bisphosphate carboxylase large chain